MNQANNLRWRFDVNTFRLIGRELITDRITAVFELVKNCYDANSQNVFIEFHDSSSKKGTIIIKDDGCGMSFNDIRDKWMVVGTASKRRDLYSPNPYHRRYVGEKGIGRFAVDKLGEKLVIETKQENDSDLLRVNIEWDVYEKHSTGEQLVLFTDIDNQYEFESSPNLSQHGTTLKISYLNEIWTKNDIDRLYKELSKIVSPFYPLNPPFNIFISSNENIKDYNQTKVISDTILYASHQASIKFDYDNNLQESLIFNKETGEINIEKIPVQIFGPVEMRLYYFNEAAKRKYNSVFKNDDSRIDGIKIYRDNIVTTPFAESVADRNKKRDILGIDKRLWSSAFDKVGSRDLIGAVFITRENNPSITDATNRQDFVDNENYRELKEFIISQLKAFEDLKLYERKEKKASINESLQQAGREIASFEKELSNITKDTPTLKPVLQPLKDQAIRIEKALSKGIIEQKKEKAEFEKRERIFLSLMSLQEYAIGLAHAVRTSLSKIKDMAEYFKNNFPNPKRDDIFKSYATLIFEEMKTLNKVIDFMLSYASSNVEFTDFNVKKVLSNLLNNEYERKFENEKIRVILEIPSNIILVGNQKLFENLFENLVANSIKFLKYEIDKIIKCSAYIEIDELIILFSDNGEGIIEENRRKVFDMFYTTTAEQGGAGLGLYIVKTILEAMKGKIEVIENELKPSGATFKITIPFNNK
jgi:signal transduction histidine kinase